jgi:hypothetical protein
MAGISEYLEFAVQSELSLELEPHDDLQRGVDSYSFVILTSNAASRSFANLD